MQRARVGVRLALIVATTLTVGACRQGDGQMPVPNADVQAELDDVARDLQGVAGGRDPQARQDLADDLRKYTHRIAAEPAVDEMSRRTAEAIAGIDLQEQAAQRLAHSLWVSVAAQQLSERQIEEVQTDMRLLLTSFGVSEQNAQQVAEQVGAVQSAVNDRPRRWYEVF